MNDSKAFIEYSNDMNDTYKNIYLYNPNNKRKMSVVIDDMIADMLTLMSLIFAGIKFCGWLDTFLIFARI